MAWLLALDGSKLDAKEDLGVNNNLRNGIAELEFFLVKEKSVVGNIENALSNSKKTIRRYNMVVVFLVLGLEAFSVLALDALKKCV
uniref:Uncharacterized protein n=1 Tax=Lactuca sativa TaxID=4236 RepID=A0A9R1VDH0_LACSA|nr:hypothetical protein LSAT_V11C500244300 [Lactuca sativa]